MSSFRGALIVLEGCDRSGKTTQCKNLGKKYFTNHKLSVLEKYILNRVPVNVFI